MKKTGYPAIRAWGRMLGSSDWYIEEQVEKARKDGAPHLATYKDEHGTWDGGWRTLDTVTNAGTQMWFERNHPELVKDIAWARSE